MGVDFVILDPAVPEIFYFKHDVRTALIIVLIGNPDVDIISDAILVLFEGNTAIKLIHEGFFTFM